MPVTKNNNTLVKNTTHKVVIPFYIYAALSFLLAAILLFTSSAVFTQHYFQPHILAVTHVMALGWGTMMILGAGHQLVPVLIEGKLFSDILAYLSFLLAAVGIPLLVYAFYTFSMGAMAQWGSLLVNAAIIFYLLNLAISMVKSKNVNVHTVCVFTSTIWLLLTTLAGLLLVYNFSYHLLSASSLYYLPVHAHMGIIGWFLLLIIGVGSRLIPMFLISKYSNTKLLWIIYSLINVCLVSFILIYLYTLQTTFYWLPIGVMVATLILFGYYCYKAFRQRIRNHVDEQMKISLVSVFMIFLPVIFLILIITSLLVSSQNIQLTMVYGFSVFFGWITALILGMTFKTLPFIVWNKVYHQKAGLGKTPNPKDLFDNRIFIMMAICYITGFILFISGVLLLKTSLVSYASFVLLITALLYNWNVLKILTHKPMIK